MFNYNNSELIIRSSPYDWTMGQFGNLTAVLAAVRYSRAGLFVAGSPSDCQVLWHHWQICTCVLGDTSTCVRLLCIFGMISLHALHGIVVSNCTKLTKFNVNIDTMT